MSDDDIREDIRGIALVLNELVNGGARICTPDERRAAWERADEALERLKARYGIPAGRGDTDPQFAPLHLDRVSFELTDETVVRYCEAGGIPLRGEAVGLGPNGPIPWCLGNGDDKTIWGYIVSYDPATRRLEVAPKR